MSQEATANDFELDPNDLPMPDSMKETEAGGEEPTKKKKKRKKSKAKAAAAAAPDGEMPPPPSPLSQIKKGPLILLVMLTGTTLLPALLYAGDWFGNFMQKQHIMGNVGHKLNIGASPKKRVLSFYEKHSPEKIEEVDVILAKYYGDYPKLVKRLERKYQDYGYFLNWEKDEAPMTLAFEKLSETKQFMQKKFNKYAPQQLKTAARNISYNLGTVHKKGRVVWKKTVWPVLEPIFGVPDGAAAQKRKDRAESKNKKGRRKKNAEYRDEEF
eukprot:CAMPEP_0197258400 /NCGR_PEP_ID=MMETSP1429-20130617/81930_1 /TAXON_ID=49237 /ORGANISM="Chaetoceros  sp., Strain UNC1202" /LENGTH=269 /DNA_ID=CAMNT_0042722497 /DNA_START=18 /DNA_END=827 /DNA_ORIENTATION=+